MEPVFKNSPSDTPVGGEGARLSACSAPDTGEDGKEGEVAETPQDNSGWDIEGGVGIGVVLASVGED